MPLITIFLQCIVTLAAGLWLIQGENFTLWTIVESELHNKRLPAEEILADLLNLGSGILLVVPGLISDAIGMALFIPALRQESIKIVSNSMKKYLNLASPEY